MLLYNMGGSIDTTSTLLNIVLMLLPGVLNSCLDNCMSVGGSGYYNALYKYLIMYVVDILLSSTIMYLGWAIVHVQCSSLVCFVHVPI